MNAQQASIGLAFQTALAVAGHTITYGRGNTTVSSIPAIPGKSTDIVDTEFGAMSKDTRDWIVNRSYLAWSNGSPIIPQPGDKIIDGTYQYEVYQPSGQDCFHFPDPNKQFIRIHTQQ